MSSYKPWSPPTRRKPLQKSEWSKKETTQNTRQDNWKIHERQHSKRGAPNEVPMRTRQPAPVGGAMATMQNIQNERSRNRQNESQRRPPQQPPQRPPQEQPYTYYHPQPPPYSHPQHPHTMYQAGPFSTPTSSRPYAYGPQVWRNQDGIPMGTPQTSGDIAADLGWVFLEGCLIGGMSEALHWFRHRRFGYEWMEW